MKINYKGSTEGNSTLMNIDNHQGSCGFMPILANLPLLGRIYPIRLLKVDPCTGEFVRDARGYCVRCKPGDTGEIVGAISPSGLMTFLHE
jgi:solute carrier family 27 fatty acid transporter 1/4